MKRTHPHRAIFIKPREGSDRKQFSRVCAVWRGGARAFPEKERRHCKSVLIIHHCQPEARSHRDPIPCSSWENEVTERSRCCPKSKTKFNKRRKWGGRASLAPFPSRAGRAQAGADTDVLSPPARTPGDAASALKGPVVKFTGGLWGCAEWALGGKQILNFQLGLDLRGGVWPVCKVAAEAFRPFGWVSKGGWR